MRSLGRVCRTALGCALLTPVLLAPAGCGGRELTPVEGVVTLDGRPLADAEVVFLPDPSAGSRGPRSAGYTDSQGRYRLRTDKGQAGASAGACLVCVNDLRVVPGVVRRDPTGANLLTAAAPPPAAGGSRVPLRYNRAAETPLRVEVGAGGPQTFDFPITSE